MDKEIKQVLESFSYRGEEAVKKTLAEHPEFYQEEEVLTELIKTGVHLFSKEYVQSHPINIDALAKAFLSNDNPTQKLNEFLIHRDFSLFPDNLWTELAQSIYENITDKETFVTRFYFSSLLPAKNLLTHADAIIKSNAKVGDYPKEFWTKDNLIKLFENTSYEFNVWDMTWTNKSDFHLKIDCSNLSEIADEKVAYSIFESINERRWGNATHKLCTFEAAYSSLQNKIQNNLDLCQSLISMDKRNYFILNEEMQNNVELIRSALKNYEDDNVHISLDDLPKKAQKTWQEYLVEFAPPTQSMVITEKHLTQFSVQQFALMVGNKVELYNVMPEQLQIEPEIGLSYINNFENHHGLKNLNKKLFQNEQFCTDVYKVYSQSAEYFPNKIWKSKKFSKEFASTLDEYINNSQDNGYMWGESKEQAKSRILGAIPEEVKEIIFNSGSAIGELSKNVEKFQEGLEALPDTPTPKKPKP